MRQTDNESERDQQKRQFVEQILNSYFLFRSPLPVAGYIQENKTTLQLMDEMLPMMAIPTEDIVAYMLEHEYGTTTEGDGTVAWAIWRQM